MTLLGYHLVLIYVKSHLEGDTKLCEEILREQLKVCINNKFNTQIQRQNYKILVKFRKLSHLIKAERNFKY